jgi:N-acetylmuramoyl-L-alanine amidase/Putative peptidoglycan binding domain
MPTLYPHADFRPLGQQTQALMKAHDIVCLHTMVGSLSGTDAFFKADGYGGTESHFGVGGNGTVYQWQDLEHTADANFKGNWHVISIETADIGPEFAKWDTNDGNAVPAWTDAQIEALANLVAWCCHTYQIPLDLVPDAKPGRRGVGYHRQGVPGFMIAGAEQWSTATGKVCPGKRRIDQIPEVLGRARELAAQAQQGLVHTPTPLGHRLLFLTSPQLRGDDVRAIQKWGDSRFDFAHLATDGIFGPATKKFVLEFQRRANLTVDGVVGPATYAAMRKQGLVLPQ